MNNKKQDLPAMPFYIGDWKKDPIVSMMSHEDKGIYLDILMLMWESDKRGYLLINNSKISIDLLAKMINLDNQRLTTWLTSYQNNFNIFGIDDDGIMYSKKQLKIIELSEKRKNAGKMGGNPNLVNQNLTSRLTIGYKGGYPNAENENEDEDEDINDINVLGKRNVKEKTIIPPFKLFLEYCKVLKTYDASLDLPLEAKYNAWVANNWKDGHDKKIKNWKTKIQNTIFYLKGTGNGTDKSPRGTIDFNKWGNLLKESQPSSTEMATGTIIKELE